MSAEFSRFDEAIWAVVSGIGQGHVMSYGDVARAAGYPRHARMVSKAMSRSSQALPWHRVIRSDMTLAFEQGSDAYERQRRLLEKEGVRFVKGKVLSAHRNETRDLDEFLWGPDA